MSIQALQLTGRHYAGFVALKPTCRPATEIECSAAKRAIPMMEPVDALGKIRRWVGFHSTAGLTDAEMANAFLVTAMEAPLAAIDECLAALPLSVRDLT